MVQGWESPLRYPAVAFEVPVERSSYLEKGAQFRNGTGMRIPQGQPRRRDPSFQVNGPGSEIDIE